MLAWPRRSLTAASPRPGEHDGHAAPPPSPDPGQASGGPWPSSAPTPAPGDPPEFGAAAPPPAQHPVVAPERLDQLNIHPSMRLRIDHYLERRSTPRRDDTLRASPRPGRLV